MAKTNLSSPRDAVGDGAIAPGMPMPPTKMPTQGKHKAKPTPKLTTKLPALPKSIPKPKVPAKLKPAGGGTGEPDPQLAVRNSPRSIRQQVPVSIPGVKTL
jgi:hypothetical protein